MQMPEWINPGINYTKNLPKLSFPLTGPMPAIYVPERTVLRMQDDTQAHAWLWCYLERKQHGNRYQFNPSSLSARRIKDLPKAIDRLSKRYLFDNARITSMKSDLGFLSAFLYWLDAPRHQGRYESILSDPDLALEALQSHHTYLRQRMQANYAGQNLSAKSASSKDFATIKTMSVIHDRQYNNEVDVIEGVHSDGVKAPKTEDVGTFMACMEGCFDSVTRIILDEPQKNKAELSLGVLRWQSGGQERTASISAGTYIERVMELGCMAFAALCLGDSGTNLAQVQACEEPEDLNEQLSQPERVNLRLKAIKLRAGGKVVPFHLTATTVTRLPAYLNLREALRLTLDCSDIAPMFVQCKYPAGATARPQAIAPIKEGFTKVLRIRFRSFGVELPLVTMRQLRAYKQGVLAKKHNPKIAADVMGHTLPTAIRYYNKRTEADCRIEMAPFMASLTSVVLTRAKDDGTDSKSTILLTEIPPGGCEDHGNPKTQEVNPLVKPDCKKTEGCFFCDNFHVHDDEKDATKLMSCRYVLERLAPGLGDSGAAEKVYDVVLSRINALLNEIKQTNPEAHERARKAVQEEGHLSPYWASKLQQMYMLGLILPNVSGSDHQIPKTHSA